MESICRVLFQGDRHACAQYDVLFLHVILNVVKNPTEELTSICFITSVVGYFAVAQYGVLFLHVILNDSEESHRRTDGAYTLLLRLWDISLALNMT